MILVRGGGRAFSYLPRRSSSRRGRVGGGGGRIIIICFCKARGGSIIFLPRMKPLKGSRWVGGELSVGGGRVIIVISAS